MAIKINSVKCPECGADLPIEEGRTQVFCSYCGTKVIITNENEHIYRHVDEAGIKRAETDRIIKLKELDMAEKSSSTRKLLTIVWLVVSGIMLLVSIIMLVWPDSSVGITGMLMLEVTAGIAFGGGVLIFKVIPDKEADRLAMQSGGIRFPKNLEPFSDKNYEMVQSALRNAGFTNITCLNLHDLTLGLLQKPGKIEKISVNGEDITSGGRVYMPDTPITITYHGK